MNVVPKNMSSGISGNSETFAWTVNSTQIAVWMLAKGHLIHMGISQNDSNIANCLYHI